MSKIIVATFLVGLVSGGVASAAGFAGKMTTTPHQGSRAVYVPANASTINRMSVGQRVIVTGSNGISTKIGTVQFHPYGGNRISYDR